MACTSVTEQKTVLRREIRQQAARIDGDIRRAQDKALFKAFVKLEAVARAKTVMLFWGVGEEPATAGLVSALLALGKRVGLPRCLPGGQMEARLYRGEPLTRGVFGIPEPGTGCPLLLKEELDVILVPALAYDKDRYRLGQGGGYYDRFLAGFTGDTVGLCYRELLREALPREGHDLPVGMVLTVTV